MLWSKRILFLVTPFFLGANGASSSTSSAPAPTQSVQVGAEGLSFTPSSLTASVGDIVEFRFYPQNHSVARAEFKQPCIPYEDTGAGKVGFWSGFHPVAVVLSNPSVFQIVVNSTEPIFFYCSAPGACIDDGMVGVINPNATETLAIQQAYAKNSTLMFSPGEYFPAETLRPTSTTSTTSSTASPTSSSTSTSSPTATSTPVAATSSGSSLSGGAIAGIAIAGFAVLLIGGALVYLCGRQRTMGEIIRHSQYAPPPPNYLPSGPGHMSMTSSTGFPPKGPNMEIDALGFRNFSSQIGPYERSPVDTESYRSRSPAHDTTGSPGATSPARADSPLMRRPVPLSPGQNPMSPLTPMGNQTRNSAVAEVLQPLRVARSSLPSGPHELSVESDRNYLPYKSPEFNEQRLK